MPTGLGKQWTTPTRVPSQPVYFAASMDPISSEYIRLSHAINRHVDGFIDAYFGPPELAVSGETVDPKTILSRVQQLRDQVRSWADEQRGDEQAVRRASYLDIQSHAMETVARKLCGQPVSFRH